MLHQWLVAAGSPILAGHVTCLLLAAWRLAVLCQEPLIMADVCILFIFFLSPSTLDLEIILLFFIIHPGELAKHV